jgi:hypothetical protein
VVLSTLLARTWVSRLPEPSRCTQAVLIEFDIESPVNTKVLNIFVRTLCAYDVYWLRLHPRTPDIYKSGVRYRSQSPGVERFLPIPAVLAAGGGDCDQLAPWRAAELRVRHGIKAMPEVVKISDRLFHVFVRYPNGKAEDISAHLGMRIPQRMAAAGRRKLQRVGNANGLSHTFVGSFWPR